MNKQKYIPLVILILVLGLTFFYRVPNLIIDDEPYYDLTVAKFYSGGSVLNDWYLVDAYQYLLIFLKNIIGLEYVLIIFAVIGAILSLIYLRKILEHYKLHENLVLMILCVFIISPQFISIYTISIKMGFSLTLLLISYYLIIKKKLLGVFILSLFTLINLFNIIIAMMVLTFTKTRKKLYHYLIILAVFLIFYIPKLIVNLFPYYHYPTTQKFLTEFIVDFGGTYGVSIFSLMLIIMGSFLLWKKAQNFHYFSTMVFIVFIYYSIQFTYLILVPFSIFAGYTIFYYYSRPWKIHFIKNLTMLIIICGLAFSFLSFFDRQTELGPSSNLIEAMEFLKSQEDGNVLSSNSNGFMIEYFSNNPALIKTKFSKDPYELYNKTQTLFHSRNLKETQILLSSYKIKYIVITPQMKKGDIWSKEDDGLLFLFRNKEVFNKIYDENVEIWSVQYE